MNDQSQESRRHAARKFVNALDELETVLKANDDRSASEDASSDLSTAELGQAADAAPADDATSSLEQMLDDAVQDIEQFMANDDSQTTASDDSQPP